MQNFQPLDGQSLASLGLDTVATFSSGQVTTFFTSVSLLWTLGIMACVGAGVFAFINSGILRMQASEASIKKSNEEFKRGSLGLIGVLILFLMLDTVNKDLLIGNIDLSALKVSSGGGQMVSNGGLLQSSQSSSQSQACSGTQQTIDSLASGNICGNVSCQALSGCAYEQYLTTINQEALAQGVDPKMVIAIMCKESKGKSSSQNQNPNGTFDCGLMQVNQPGTCDSASLDPATNIRRGVQKIKNIINSTQANEIYGGVPAKTGIFATYNCCSNGTQPNAPSVDCTALNGFNSTIPKWACPINPGSGKFNMCAVRSYTCELAACIDQL